MDSLPAFLAISHLLAAAASGPLVWHYTGRGKAKPAGGGRGTGLGQGMCQAAHLQLRDARRDEPWTPTLLLKIYHRYRPPSAQSDPMEVRALILLVPNAV